MDEILGGIMIVTIKNKFFSLRGSSSVKSNTGEDLFFVKGRLFSPTKVKWVCDRKGNKLYKVRNKWINFIAHRVYIYDRNAKIAKVKHPLFGGKKFIIEGYKDEIVIQGEFFSPESSIIRDGKTIGIIRRNLSIVNDTFSLEAEEEDMPFLIALVIAIDNIFDKITKSR